MVSVEDLKSRLDALLEREGLTHTDLWQGIPMTESGYYRMLRNGSMDVRTLLSIATTMRVDPAVILGDAVPLSTAMNVANEPAAPYGIKPKYLEDRVSELEAAVQKRVAFLETEVRKLKEKQRPK